MEMDIEKTPSDIDADAYEPQITSDDAALYEEYPTEPEQLELFSESQDNSTDDENAAADVEDEPSAESVPVPEVDNTADAEPVKEKPKKERRVDTLFDFIELFVFTLAAVLFLTSFVVRHSTVVGGSMENTLHDGETLLISNLFYEPKKNDIVVVSDYSTDLKKPIVKRVIATEGDLIRITKDAIFVNGEILLEDSYVHLDNPAYKYTIEPSHALVENERIEIKFIFDNGARVGYEFEIPSGELFVMGDHRDDSADSRTIGTVREDAVLGRVILRIFPFAKFGTVN